MIDEFKFSDTKKSPETFCTQSDTIKKFANKQLNGMARLEMPNIADKFIEIPEKG